MKGALIEDRNKNLVEKGHMEQTKLGSLNVNHRVTEDNKYNLYRILNQINHNVGYNKTNLYKCELKIIDDLITSLIKNREKKNKEGN